MNELDPKYVPPEVLRHQRNIMASRAMFLRLRRLHYDICPPQHKFLPALYVAPNCNAEQIVFHDLDLPEHATPLKTIILTVAHYYKKRQWQLLRPRRTASEVRARQVAMYLAAEMTETSIAGIGRFFKRDHTTVLHARRKIIKLMETDQPLRLAIAAIRKQIETVVEIPTPERVRVIRARGSAQAMHFQPKGQERFQGAV